MNQISPHPVWIGHAGDGRDVSAILVAEIRAVVQLALEEPPLQLPRELIYLRFPLLDGSGNDAGLLRLTVITVGELVKLQCPTLVCCSGGMSRSPAIVAAALSAMDDTDVDECLARITRSHPADVSPGLWKEVRDSLSHGTPL